MAQEFQLQKSPSGKVADLHVTVPHYRFGLWEPTLAFGGGTTGITGTHYSQYLLLGNRVFVDTDITFTSKGSSTGVAEIYFLPFGSTGNLPPVSLMMFNMTTSFVSVYAKIIVGSLGVIAIGLYGYTVAATSPTAMTDADFSDTTELHCSGHYTINPS